MKTIFYLLACLFLSFVVVIPAVAQVPCEVLFEPVAETIRKTNADAFADYFAEAIECDILGEEQVYSKGQSRQIIRNLFKSDGNVKYFTIKHCSGKEYLKYAIGTVTTFTDAHYRLTMFAIVNNGKPVIQQLRVEKQQ